MSSIAPSRTHYTRAMQELEQQLLQMVAGAETMLGLAVEALQDLDTELAKSVIKMDDEIDDLDMQIESGCLKLLALQQPMGSDLREIGTVMKMITDIERIGDHAVDIAKFSRKIEKEMGSSDLVDIPLMGQYARKMIRSAAEAFVKRDISVLDAVVKGETLVDELYRENRKQIHAHMRDHPQDVVSASWLLLAVHHIERTADHALNMAERVHYMVTGEFKQLDPSNQPGQPN